MKLATLAWLCTWLNLAAGEPSPASLEDLTAHVRSNVVARTNGTTSLMFSTWEQGTRFVRNPRFWLNGMNGLSAIHVGYGPGATAITPWHVVGANHWKNEVGAKLYFCDAQNHTILRTVVAGTEIRSDI